MGKKIEELVKPEDWSEEGWAEYVAWHESLPEDVEREDSRQAVINGRDPGDLQELRQPEEVILFRIGTYVLK